MNLDQYTEFSSLDSLNMLAQIDGLPEQMLDAWEHGGKYALPDWKGIRQILVAGMGGSAIGADLLSAYAQSTAYIPVSIYRDYGLPTWASGPETLVIASSHSGNTEETLSVLERALENRCRCVAVSTGGKLARMAEEARIPYWQFNHDHQPRTAVGYSFTLLLAILVRLYLLPDPVDDFMGAVQAMRKQQKILRVDVPIVENPAKRIAGQLIGRWVTVFGSGILAPVARRWKGQISEIAKAWAQFEFLPEADHNTLAGLQNPEELFPRMAALFLRASSDHPRNRLRSDLTRKAFMLEGVATDFIDARGETGMAQMWTCLQFGDYTAYYMAMGYEVDPTPVLALESFKSEMRSVE